MKKTIVIALIIGNTLFIECTHSKKQNSIVNVNKNCLEEKILSYSKNSCSSGAKIKEYSFQNKKVYAFEPGNCGADMTIEVLDDKCNSLGFLGGITGNTKINNEDFSNSVFVKIIWQNQEAANSEK